MKYINFVFWMSIWFWILMVFYVHKMFDAPWNHAWINHTLSHNRFEISLIGRLDSSSPPFTTTSFDAIVDAAETKEWLDFDTMRQQ